MSDDDLIWRRQRAMELTAQLPDDVDKARAVPAEMRVLLDWVSGQSLREAVVKFPVRDR